MAKKEKLRKECVYIPGMTEALKKGKVPLSPAVKANGFVFVSGLPPIDTKTGKLVNGDISRQTRQSLRNVRDALKAAGSSMDQVVKVNIYCSNSGYFDRINDEYRKFFPKNPPARTFVTVGSWPWEFDVEIECTALCDL
ncbi:MAG: 2-iminobutanoate/2-iminopropanoate deaminase [Alphaproteobacteria bacterium MarineAlpha11_Bin1]|nr:MAG: 2-iminobutanoate/2-iminopropanoate deaminase [Alphaproteobacteria bacterium MarineAlpha11_Bin1]|tara:strand:+ start:8206 stop:8622 length:417 start_codon:yes stop_codon:yes gene_type:complete